MGVRKVPVKRSRVKEVLKIRDKKLNAVCIKARLSYETVRYCLREGKIMPDILQDLAKALNCKVTYLTGEDNTNASLWETLNFTADQTHWIDSEGYLILPYEDVYIDETDDAFHSYEDAALIVFSKMVPFLKKCIAVQVTDQEGKESMYTFDDYLKDQTEIEFYNNFENVLKKKKYNSSTVSEDKVFSTLFDIVRLSLEKDMQRVHRDKALIIRSLKEEVHNTDKLTRETYIEVFKKIHNAE